jgi:hypothetical protein
MTTQRHHKKMKMGNTDMRDIEPEMPIGQIHQLAGGIFLGGIVRLGIQLDFTRAIDSFNTTADR